MDDYIARQYSLSQLLADKCSYRRNLLNSWDLVRVMSIFVDPSLRGITLVLYLMEQGILPRDRICPRAACQQPMNLWQNTAFKKDGCNWYCKNRYSKKSKRHCDTKLSVRTGSFFYGSRLTLPEMVNPLSKSIISIILNF